LARGTVVTASAPSTTEAALLWHADVLLPAQARSFLCFPFTVPVGTGGLRIRLAFSPARVNRLRNLLTISLFDPRGFRGAGHRHAPRQEIELGPSGATPGFLPGPIPPGEWLLEVDCHAVLARPGGALEYEVSVSALKGAADPSAAGAGDEIPGQPVDEPAPRGDQNEPETDAPPGWLKGDLHLHSNHSDGRWTIDELVRYVERHELDFLALTDHNTVSGTEPLRRALAAAGLRTVLIPAMELTTFYGHANALGVTEWIDWRVRGPEGWPRTIGSGRDAPATTTMAVAAAAVRSLGGTFVVNHPCAKGYPACTGCRWELGDAAATYADAVEVWNGPWDRSKNGQALALWTRWLNSGRRISATAGSDSHRAPEHGAPTGYTYAHAPRDSKAILAAVRAGRTYLSRGPHLAWSPAPRRMGAEGRPGGVHLEVKHLTVPADLQLVRNGRTVWRVPAGSREGEIVELPESRGTAWYRAELYRAGTDDLLAITNPLFGSAASLPAAP
jgi:hypothetical protein